MGAFFTPHGLLDGVSCEEEGSVLRLRAAAGARGAAFIVLSPEGECSGTIEVDLAPAATLSLVLLARSDRPAACAARVTVGRGARCRIFLALRGSVDGTLHCLVKGEDAACDVNGVFVAEGDDRQHMAITTDFLSRAGGGEIAMAGIARDRAHAKVEGTIRIAPRGRGTQTHLSQRVLLLDGAAVVDVVPALKIETDDVRAGHEASVTKPPPEDLFYLASRGLAEEEARRMLVEGFLKEPLGRIGEDAVRREVENAMTYEKAEKSETYER